MGDRKKESERERRHRERENIREGKERVKKEKRKNQRKRHREERKRKETALFLVHRKESDSGIYMTCILRKFEVLKSKFKKLSNFQLIQRSHRHLSV